MRYVQYITEYSWIMEKPYASDHINCAFLILREVN
jgi:hypothetical protein